MLIQHTGYNSNYCLLSTSVPEILLHYIYIFLFISYNTLLLYLFLPLNKSKLREVKRFAQSHVVVSLRSKIRSDLGLPDKAFQSVTAMLGRLSVFIN